MVHPFYGRGQPFHDGDRFEAQFVVEPNESPAKDVGHTLLFDFDRGTTGIPLVSTTRVVQQENSDTIVVLFFI